MPAFLVCQPSGDMKLPPHLPSERSFGFTFAAVFALVGAWLWWKSSRYALPVFGIGAAFGLIAITVPVILKPLNIVWAYVGLVLNMIVSPIIMGVIYFGVFTPVSLFFKLTKRDSLHRKFDKAARSYWIDRTPPGPDGASLPRQF
jgi:predicted membrane metal-binding protein